MRSASFHVHPVHHVGSFSLIHLVYPAHLSYKGINAIIREESIIKCISKTAYYCDNMEHWQHVESSVASSSLKEKSGYKREL
jgi:hypothetical protein